jgi:hypothetical protein
MRATRIREWPRWPNYGIGRLCQAASLVAGTPLAPSRDCRPLRGGRSRPRESPPPPLRGRSRDRRTQRSVHRRSREHAGVCAGRRPDGRRSARQREVRPPPEARLRALRHCAKERGLSAARRLRLSRFAPAPRRSPEGPGTDILARSVEARLRPLVTPGRDQCGAAQQAAGSRALDEQPLRDPPLRPRVDDV